MDDTQTFSQTNTVTHTPSRLMPGKKFVLILIALIFLLTTAIFFLTTTAANKQNETIKTQTKPQLDSLIQVDYSISKVKTFENDWAIIEVTNPEAGPANVILKKENDTWKVIKGPGTYFDPDQLHQIGAPQSLIQKANANL